MQCIKRFYSNVLLQIYFSLYFREQSHAAAIVFFILSDFGVVAVISFLLIAWEDTSSAE